MYNGDTCTVKLVCENSTMRSIIAHFGESGVTAAVDARRFRAVVDVVPSPPFYA